MQHFLGQQEEQCSMPDSNSVLPEPQTSDYFNMNSSIFKSEMDHPYKGRLHNHAQLKNIGFPVYASEMKNHPLSLLVLPDGYIKGNHVWKWNQVDQDGGLSGPRRKAFRKISM